MRSNNVECSTSTGMYCTTNDVRVPFYMPETSTSKITPHRFHVDNNECKLGIRYAMIIGRDLIVQLGPSENFKRQVPQWDGVTVPMEVTGYRIVYGTRVMYD